MVPFLAQYTIRSKQAYIFRTNRLREVTGASTLIATAFDRLFSAAEGIGLKVRRASAGERFSLGDTLKAFEEGTLQMAELFEGGGNDTVLMADEEIFRRVNRAFTCQLLKETPGMIPMCAGVPVQPDEAGLFHYREDYTRLTEKAGAVKSTMVSGQAGGALPFAMTDSVTRQPFQPDKPRNAIPNARYTPESFAKMNAYAEARMDGETARQLDDLLGDDDSMLAIVHADGNNMGRKLKALLGDHTDYDTCVAILRSFSETIDRIYVQEGNDSLRSELDRIREEYRHEDQRIFAVRSLISDGDDFTFICNARWALRLTKAYLQGVGAHEGHSACAGICLFHRHYPFARAYDLAEQACDQAKRKVHREGSPDECWIDFHYLHGGVPDDLEETRREQGTAACIFRPWRCDKEDDPKSVDRLEQLSGMIAASAGDEERTTRTNLKTLGAALEISEHEAASEMERIFFRAPALKTKLCALFPDESDMMKAVYDLSEVYDLWFAGRK